MPPAPNRASKKRTLTKNGENFERERRTSTHMDPLNHVPTPTTIGTNDTTCQCMSQNTTKNKRPKHDSLSASSPVSVSASESITVTVTVQVTHITSQSNQPISNSKDNDQDITKSEGATDMDMNEESCTQPLATLPFPPFIPLHGLLKLPQSVASALASDFLWKREIRDLGVTCRWMMGSLCDCSINEPISLPFAIDRLNRQQLAVSSEWISADPPRERVTARIPHMWLGRFRYIAFRDTIHAIMGLLPEMTETEVKLLSEVHRLVDCRKFTLNLSNSSSDDIKEKLPAYMPIVLPHHLQEFHVGQLGNLISIGDFVLPSSLKKIEFVPQRNSKLGRCVSKIKWPTVPFQLKTALGLEIFSPLKETLSLPEGLTTVSFRQPHLAFPITNVTLPNSITNLELPIWHDQNGRYRDIVFPSALKRLVFTGEMDKDDLDLTQWGLPFSCENIELVLVNERGWYQPDKPIGLHLLEPSSPIIVPRFTKCFRIRRSCGSTKWQLPTLELTHASSLTALLTDSLERIQWPDASSGALKSVKLTLVYNQEVLSDVLPTCLQPNGIQMVDLSEVDSSYVNVHLTDYQRCRTIFPNLAHLITPINYKIELVNKDDPTHPMVPAFRQVMSEIYYKYATMVTDNRLITSEPRKTMSKTDMKNYILACGVVNEKSTDDQRLTNIFTKFALPVGWTNYEELTVDGFCEFYRDACTNRVDYVWNDLRAHGYQRVLIIDQFLDHLADVSMGFPNCIIEGRIGLDDRSPILIIHQPDIYDWFDCYQFLNGVQVRNSRMTRAESKDESRFDFNPLL